MELVSKNEVIDLVNKKINYEQTIEFYDKEAKIDALSLLNEIERLSCFPVADNKEFVKNIKIMTLQDCSFPLCKHTSNINCAENFNKETEGIYFEKLKIVQSRRKNRRICKCHLRKKKKN